MIFSLQAVRTAARDVPVSSIDGHMARSRRQLTTQRLAD